MAGFMIDNIAKGLKQWHWEDAGTLPRDGSVTLLDTRTDTEVARGRIDGFMHIPVDSLRERISEIPADKPVYVHCHSGLRSYIACRILAGYGFTCYNLAGGWRLYESVINERTVPEYICTMDAIKSITFAITICIITYPFLCKHLLHSTTLSNQTPPFATHLVLFRNYISLT